MDHRLIVVDPGVTDYSTWPSLSCSSYLVDDLWYLGNENSVGTIMTPCNNCIIEIVLFNNGQLNLSGPF